MTLNSLRRKNKSLEREISATIAKMERILHQEQLATLVRMRMRERSLSVSQVAELSGLHYQTVSRFMGLTKPATRLPRLQTTLVIARALGWNLYIG